MEMPAKPDTPELYHRLTDILKCKWTLAILDGIRRGINRPGRLEKELPGLTPKVLNDRIKKLERYGIIQRITYPEIPPHVEYVFTPRGEALLELLKHIRGFVEEWEAESQASALPDRP
jgi:DNA-binding HxlR family transcriptional regulator